MRKPPGRRGSRPASLRMLWYYKLRRLCESRWFHTNDFADQIYRPSTLFAHHRERCPPPEYLSSRRRNGDSDDGVHLISSCPAPHSQPQIFEEPSPVVLIVFDTRYSVFIYDQDAIMEWYSLSGTLSQATFSCKAALHSQGMTMDPPIHHMHGVVRASKTSLGLSGGRWEWPVTPFRMGVRHSLVKIRRNDGESKIRQKGRG